MPTHEQTKLLPYSLDELYALVGDVAHYPEFIPWCAAARVLSGNPDPWAGEEMLAELVIRYKLIQESYVSRVRFQPPTPEARIARVTATLERGPFTHLLNDWQLLAHGPQETEVVFLVDFGFRSRLLEQLLSAWFTRATLTMTEAFEKRAEKLYRL